GSGSGQGHRRGAVHGGAARRRITLLRRGITRGKSKTKVDRGGRGPYLKAGSGDSSAAAMARRWPGATVGTSAAARGTAGERGQREIGRGRGIGARPGLRTSGRSSPGKGAAELQRRRERARDGGVMAAALCVRAARGKRKVYWSANGGGERASGARGSSGQGRVVASSTRDVGAEKAGAQLGGGYAGTTGLTAGPASRERESGGGRARTAALTGGPARAERAGGRGRRAGWAYWAERPRRGSGLLSFSFILELFSLFFYFLH
ncbi:hypothetical protein Zm00014a_015106, partial [Zea mays]